MRTAVGCFVTYNLYLSVHLVRLRLEVVVQNDGDLMEVPYFSIDNAHPKLFRHSFWCIDNVRDVFFDR